MANIPDNDASYWREFYPKRQYRALKDGLSVDVAIIGAGITGLTTAYLLKQAGFKVAVLEKDTVGGGTTGRTTGKVTSQHGLTYHDLQKYTGKDTARAYGAANESAIEQVEKIIKAERIDCDWERDDHYVYTTHASKVKQLRQEAETAARLGLPASFETSTPLPFPVQAAVKFANQAKMNSQKYVLGLAKAVHGDGCYVFEDSNVIGIRDGTRCRVRTSKASVYAKNTIVATNVPTLPLLARGGYCILEYPTESFIVSGKPEKHIDGMYISPDSDNYSILPINVDGRPALLIGGEGGHLPGLRLGKKHKYKRLAGYAKEHFGVDTITNAWSDRDYLAYDEIPLVGKLYAWSKHVYVATAFRKWGLTNGTAAAMLLRDTLTGTKNEWATYCDPIRAQAVTSIPRAVVRYIRS